MRRLRLSLLLCEALLFFGWLYVVGLFAFGVVGFSPAWLVAPLLLIGFVRGTWAALCLIVSVIVGLIAGLKRLQRRDETQYVRSQRLRRAD